MKKHIIISFGDPGGISAELLLKELNRISKYNILTVIIGSIDSIDYFSKRFSIEYKDKIIFIKSYKSLIDFIEKYNNLEDSGLEKNILFYDPFYSPDNEFKLFNLKKYKKYICLDSRLDKAGEFKENFYNHSKDNSINSNDKVKEIFINKKELINNSLKFKIGKISSINGFLSERYIFISLYLIKYLLNNGFKKVVLLTLPVNKKSISYCIPDFIGHTEYIAKFFKIKNFTMIMHSDNITVGLVSTHVPISKLNKVINKNKFKITAENLYNFIRKFRISGKIIVTGLNPHASDNGLIGKEEIWIKKLILTLNDYYFEKYRERPFIGPVPADTVFSVYKKNIENKVFVAFYHDQGLIPFKILSKGKGVNITYGLPFMRISPEHGVAFDITNRGIASTSSFLKAFEIASKF